MASEIASIEGRQPTSARFRGSPRLPLLDLCDSVRLGGRREGWWVSVVCFVGAAGVCCVLAGAN
jgi:hypothetical protein